MLGALLRIREQVSGEGSVGLCIGASRTRPGDRTEGGGASFQTDKHLGRGSNDEQRFAVHGTEIEKEHIG